MAAWGRTNPEVDHENYHFFGTDVSNWDNVQGSYKLTMTSWVNLQF